MALDVRRSACRGGRGAQADDDAHADVVDADRRGRGDGHARVHGARAGARRARRSARRRVRARRDALSPARRRAAVQRAHRDRRDRRGGARQGRAARASASTARPRISSRSSSARWRRSPADRYPHAGELADELRRFLTGQLVGAHRYTTLQRRRAGSSRSTARRSRSRRVAVIAFAVFGTLAVRQIVEQRDRAQREQQIADHAPRRRREADRQDAVGREDAARSRSAGSMCSRTSAARSATTTRRCRAHARRHARRGRRSAMAKAVEHRRPRRARLRPARSSAHDVDRSARAARRVGRRRRLAASTLLRARDDRAVRLRDRDDLPGARQDRRRRSRSFKQAKTQFDALRARPARTHDAARRRRHPRSARRPAAQRRQDRRGVRGVLAGEERARARASSGDGRPSEEVLALSTSHLKLGSVYSDARRVGRRARGVSGSRCACARRCSRRSPTTSRCQGAVLDVQREIAELQRQLGDDKGAIETYRAALPHRASRCAPRSDEHRRGSASAAISCRTSASRCSTPASSRTALDAARGRDRDPEGARRTRREELAWQDRRCRARTRAPATARMLPRRDRPTAIDVVRAARSTIRSELVEADAEERAVSPRRSRGRTPSSRNAYTLKATLARAIEAHEKALALREAARRGVAGAGRLQERARVDARSSSAELLATRDPKRAARADRVGPRSRARAGRRRRDQHRVERDADPGPARAGRAREARPATRPRAPPRSTRRSRRERRRRARAAERALAGLRRRDPRRPRRACDPRCEGRRRRVEARRATSSSRSRKAGSASRDAQDAARARAPASCDTMASWATNRRARIHGQGPNRKMWTYLILMVVLDRDRDRDQRGLEEPRRSADGHEELPRSAELGARDGDVPRRRGRVLARPQDRDRLAGGDRRILDRGARSRAVELIVGWNKFALGGIVVIPYIIPLVVFVLLLMYGMKKSASVAHIKVVRHVLDRQHG